MCLKFAQQGWGGVGGTSLLSGFLILSFPRIPWATEKLEISLDDGKKRIMLICRILTVIHTQKYPLQK